MHPVGICYSSEVTFSKHRQILSCGLLKYQPCLKCFSNNTLISRSRYFEIESEAPVGRKPEVSPLITGESWMRWRIVVFNDVVSILKLYIHFFHTLDYIQWNSFINNIYIFFIYNSESKKRSRNELYTYPILDINIQ